VIPQGPLKIGDGSWRFTHRLERSERLISQLPFQKGDRGCHFMT
jgi:hypothetical protein